MESTVIAKSRDYRGSYLAYFLMYMFYYFGMAMFSALISVYLMGKGYNASEVSAVVSAALVMSMILQPIVGGLNDRFDRKAVNSVFLIIAAVMGILFIFSGNFIMTAITYSVGSASLGATNPVIERMATTSRHKYSAIRIWGTIGYATGSQIGGIIYSHISPESMYVFFVASMVLCVAGLLGTREDRPIEDNKSAKEPRQKLKITKEIVVYLVIACLFYGITNVNGIYLPSMYQSEGLSVDQTTLVLFLGTLMELPVILLSKFYMNRFSNKLLLQLSFVLLIIQFGAYSFIPVVAIQIAITILTRSVVTMAFIMINIKVIATIVDASHQMTALALVSTIKSLICIAFQTAAGLIIDNFSYRVFYIVLFASSCAALVISSLYKVADGNDKKLFS